MIRYHLGGRVNGDPNKSWHYVRDCGDIKFVERLMNAPVVGGAAPPDEKNEF